MKDSAPTALDTPEIGTQDPEVMRLFLQSILESVPDAMIVINQRGIILAFSRAAEALFGYASEDVAGKNVSMLMTGTDSGHHDRYMSNYLETGQKQIIGIGRVVEARLANGDTVPVELKIGEARIGEERLFTGYIRDVSAQRAAELRTQEMQAELTNFSRLSAVCTMASAMAHELNQPLTAVSNYLEAARDLLDTPKEETVSVIKEALSEASSQSVRAGQIIRRLRDFVSRGEMDLRPTPLEPVITEAVSLAKIGQENHLPRINVAIGPDADAVMADEVQLRQVIINLVRNAIEAMADTSDPQISIRAGTTQQGAVEVEIIDNGPGFSNAVSESIFQPFNSSKPTGMGLGLSICQTIIESHNGTIRAFDAPGGGAGFQFRLKPAQAAGSTE